MARQSLNETSPVRKSWRRPSEKDRELTKVGLSVLRSEEMLVGGSNLVPRKLEIRTRLVRGFVLLPQRVQFPESPNFVSIFFLRTPLAVPLLWLRGSGGPRGPEPPELSKLHPPSRGLPPQVRPPGPGNSGKGGPRRRGGRSEGPGTVRGPGDGVRGPESDRARDQRGPDLLGPLPEGGD